MTTQRLTHLGFESFWWGGLLCVCFAVSLFAVISIYRYERRLVSRPVGWGLLALRTGVLLLLLWIALQPTLTWTRDIKQQNRLLVALDVSESMDLVDDHATDLERLQWAVGLGMVKPEMLQQNGSPPRQPRLPAEQGAGAQTETDTTASGETGSPTPEGNSEDYHQLLESWDTLSRFELARQLLAAPQRGLLTQLDRLARTDILLFSRKTRGVSPEDLTGSRASLSENLVPEATSFTEVLQEAATRDHYTGVVVLSDGVDTTRDQPLEAATQLAELSRPIYSILTGSLNPPVDLSIESIDYPDSVYKNDQPLIRVRAGTHGYHYQPLVITLTDVATGTRLSKDATGGERFVDVEFDLPLKEPGRQRFIVEVQPRGDVDAARVERRLDNNQQEFGINVIDDTAHVLLVDGEGRWEFRYLEAAFQRDDRVDLTAVLFEQPYLGLLPHPFFPTALPDAKKPGGPFEKQDLVIWGDADSRDVDQATWEQLEKFVAERGGTLVLSSGKRHFASLLRNPVLSKLLPITHYRPIESARDDVGLAPRERGFHLQLTPQGRTHPLMKLETDGTRNSEAWESLPGHAWGLAGVPKPGAQVLATAVNATQVASASGPQAVIVMQNYGLGRVVWLGVDSTWRWRARTGDRDHYRFWGQLTRWAAEMRTSAGSDKVRFGLEQAEVPVGEEAMVRARWSPSVSDQARELKAFVEVFPADQRQTVPILSFPLEGLETEPLLHEGRVPPLPVGEYRLQLKSREMDLGPQPIEARLFVAPRRSGETQRLAADRALLDQFASITGGAVFMPHQVDQLLERILPEYGELQEKRDIPLWNHWSLFVMMLLVLSAEWLLRKWYGLP